MTEIKQAEKRTLRRFYPLIGLIVLIISGGVAYLAHVPVANLLQQRLPPDVVQVFGANFPIAVGGLIFILMMMIIFLVVAVFSGGGGRGKDTIRVSEKELEKERAERQREEIAAKKRKAKMRQKMKEQRRRNR